MIAKGNSYFWTSVSRTFCTQNQLSGTSEMNHTMTFKFPSIFCQSDEPANDTRGLLPVSTSFLQILTHIVIAVWFNAQRGQLWRERPTGPGYPKFSVALGGEKKRDDLHSSSLRHRQQWVTKSLLVWVSGTRSPLIQTSECGKRPERETNWLI